jgi:Domain of unknown function (DUF4190)
MNPAGRLLCEATMNCPTCGAPNPDDAVRCQECGVSLELPTVRAAGEGRPRPRRRPEDDEVEAEADDPVATIIPYRNGRALAAYYLGVFSLIPCLGLLLGPAALTFGILGLRYVRANPRAKGTGHAIAGIILGSLTTLANLGVLLFVVIGMIYSAQRR